MYKFIILLFLTSICFSQQVNIVNIDHHNVYCDCGTVKPTYTIKVINVISKYEMEYNLENHATVEMDIPKGKLDNNIIR
jgi:hypothetical protein